MDASTRVVLDKLKVAFPQGPPTAEQVRGQEFAWGRSQWEKRWPAGMYRPAALDSQEAVAVSRRDVHRRAERVDTEADALELYLLMAAWGTGTKARAIARAARPLQEEGVAATLLQAHSAARSEEPADCYAQMLRGGSLRIKHLGPAFFTKWIYFAGFEAGSSGRARPLILDARVARTLGWATWGWSASSYARYIAVSEALRDAWCPEAPTDVIEYALFTANGA